MDSSFYKDELYKMESNYKNKPLKNLNLTRPDWLDFHDPMSRMYEEKSTATPHSVQNKKKVI